MPLQFPKRFRGPAAVLLLASATGVFADNPATQPAVADVPISSANGATVLPLVVPPPKKAAVLLFVATECPISNGYAPEIARLAHAAGDGNFAFYLVYSDPDLRPDDVVKHQAAYGLPGTPLLDGKLVLAHAFGVKRTPTVLVVGQGGAVRYRGAIDDAYAGVGRKKFAATQHYLADALRQIAEDKTVALPETEAVGCELE